MDNPKETMTQMILAAICMIMVLVFVGFVLFLDEPRAIRANCDTDTDCIRLCDPNDKQCDGGPQ